MSLKATSNYLCRHAIFNRKHVAVIPKIYINFVYLQKLKPCQTDRQTNAMNSFKLCCKPVISKVGDWNRLGNDFFMILDDNYVLCIYFIPCFMFNHM